ncbi:CehA/McbA family metallohydrolase domain-containing protein [Echinicola shivajiensis]|uniref:histidinol-phosphatase n=1 Tax=Echinicola shivajiensis TaxID=1035916 RepID=UPI001BFC3B5C|nr:histidinol-phosphatase [Echinicola shivajiensis]
MRLIQFLVLLAVLSSCSNSKETVEEKNWYKGNLHTHSYWSDGDDYPEMIMDWYKSHGYDFAVLSDHNVLARQERWKVVPKSPTHQKAFDKYLEQYGEDWVEYREDSAGRVEVKLKTLEEYRTLFEENEKFLIVESEEVTASFEKKPLHMNVTNIQELIEPQGGNSIPEILQNNIDKVKEQRELTGEPMFLHINHPNFGWAISPEDIIQLNGERFFEVYNGHPYVNNYGDSLRPSMEMLWDKVQVAYLQASKPLLYGLAVDDAHNYHVFNEKSSNPGRGWVVVRSSELKPTALIEAMEAGDFYASTGVSFKRLDFDGKTLSLEVDVEAGVHYTIQFFGTKKSSPEKYGALLKEVKDASAEYTLQIDDMYVRAKVVSSKPKENPYKPGDTELAWTQPVVME